MKNQTLIQDLSADIRTILREMETIKSKPISELNRLRSDGGWSAAQCLQHLNIYAAYYLPAIETALSRHADRKANEFSPGWLGGYFTRLMTLDNSGKVKKKMKAPKNATPSVAPDATKEVRDFISHQHHLLNLLQIAAQSDLNSIRVPISIAPFIRLKLGDVFLFFTEHQKRHMEQMKRTLIS